MLLVETVCPQQLHATPPNTASNIPALIVVGTVGHSQHRLLYPFLVLYFLVIIIISHQGPFDQHIF
jgi:hypothetical protein